MPPTSFHQHVKTGLTEPFVFPVPENFQMAQSIAESSIDAWGEHDRRMR